MYVSVNRMLPATFEGSVEPPDEAKNKTEPSITVFPFGIAEGGQAHFSFSIEEAERFAAKLAELAQAARRGDYSSAETRSQG